jgi:hypothetical protein
MRTLRDINTHILVMSESTWVDTDGKEHKFNISTWKEDLKGLTGETSSLKTKTYYNADSKPKHWLWWCRWDPPKSIEYRTAKTTLPASAVSVDTDPYWPEGFEPDVEGHFIHGDLILMKRPYVDHLKDEIAKIKRSKGSAKAKMDEFNEMTKREGAGLSGKAKDDIGSVI